MIVHVPLRSLYFGKCLSILSLQMFEHNNLYILLNFFFVFFLAFK